MACFERFMEIMEIEPDIRDAADAIELRQVEGNLVFKDVAFRYRITRTMSCKTCLLM
jgi:ATP-binding cassette subfamily B protein